MKKVLNNSGVIHYFTQNFNNIDDVCIDVRSNNMSIGKGYNNDDSIVLYSYSTKIALRNLTQNIYLISERSYSVTTSKQQRELKQGVYNYISVYDINDSNDRNLKSYLNDIKNYSISQSKARKKDYIHEIESTLKNMILFLDYIKIDKRSKLYKACISLNNFYSVIPFDMFITHVLKLNEVEIKANKAKDKKQKKDIAIANQKLIDSVTNKSLNEILFFRQKYFNENKDLKMINHYNHLYRENVDIINRFGLKEFYYFLNHKDILRVTDKCNAITNQRVTIAKKDIKSLYFAIVTGKIKRGDTVLEYTCNHIDSDSITIGCHKFAINDIKETYTIFKDSSCI